MNQLKWTLSNYSISKINTSERSSQLDWPDDIHELFIRRKDKNLLASAQRRRRQRKNKQREKTI